MLVRLKFLSVQFSDEQHSSNKIYFVLIYVFGASFCNEETVEEKNYKSMLQCSALLEPQQYLKEPILQQTCGHLQYSIMVRSFFIKDFQIIGKRELDPLYGLLAHMICQPETASYVVIRPILRTKSFPIQV